MAMPLWTMLYRRFGGRYPGFYLTLELQSAFFIFFYNAPADAYLRTLAVVEALTILGVGFTLLRTYPRLAPIRRWIEGDRGTEQTAEAWNEAVGLPLNLVKADIKIPTLVVVLPGCIAATAFLHLAWWSFFPLVAGSFIAL